ARRRRPGVRPEARQRVRPGSRRKLARCAWNVLVTNAPRGLLRLAEALAVQRVRWPIALVFQVFKSEGGIERTRSRCPSRVLCELYAQLLGMLVQQWALLAAGDRMRRPSGRRAARRRAGLGTAAALAGEVARLAVILERRCRVVSRKAEPSTLDRLHTRDPDGDQKRKVA